MQFKKLKLTKKIQNTKNPENKINTKSERKPAETTYKSKITTTWFNEKQYFNRRAERQRFKFAGGLQKEQRQRNTKQGRTIKRQKTKKNRN